MAVRHDRDRRRREVMCCECHHPAAAVVVDPDATDPDPMPHCRMCSTERLERDAREYPIGAFYEELDTPTVSQYYPHPGELELVEIDDDEQAWLCAENDRSFVNLGEMV